MSEDYLQEGDLPLRSGGVSSLTSWLCASSARARASRAWAITRRSFGTLARISALRRCMLHALSVASFSRPRAGRRSHSARDGEACMSRIPASNHASRRMDSELGRCPGRTRALSMAADRRRPAWSGWPCGSTTVRPSVREWLLCRPTNSPNLAKET